MNFYNRIILPRAIDLVCGMKPTMRQRKKVVPIAEGNVLEIGIGSGLNIPFYNPDKVKKITGIDPSEEILSMAGKKASNSNIPVELINLYSNGIPLEKKSIDTVVMTYTLCTIKIPDITLNEIKRVLKPGGKLLFCEHGISPDKKVRRIQNMADPIWSRFTGGCHLNRDIPLLFEQGGFKISHLESGYIKGWKAASYNYSGAATI